MASDLDGSGLNDRQQAFVNEYLIDLNATQATIRAGYSENGAGQTGYQLLKNTQIQQAIQAAIEERAKRTKITQDRVLYELARIAFANMGEYITVQNDGSAYVDLSGLTADQGAAIQEIISETYEDGRGEDSVPVKKVKLKLHARTSALEMLGRHLALFTDKHQHDISQTGVVLEIVQPNTGTDDGSGTD